PAVSCTAGVLPHGARGRGIDADVAGWVVVARPFVHPSAPIVVSPDTAAGSGRCSGRTPTPFILRTVQGASHGSAQVQDVPCAHALPPLAVEGEQRRPRAGDGPRPHRQRPAPPREGLPARPPPDRG